MNFAIDADSSQWPALHAQNSHPVEQTHSLCCDIAIKHSGTCADTLGTFALKSHEQQLELKQTSSSSSEISRQLRGHMLHVTMQCLPTQYSDKL
jgi:hypothetical protein